MSSSDRASSIARAGYAPTPRSFASLIGKLEKDLLDQVVPPGGGLAKATMALANRWITTRQLGLLLGFMGRRVLGQYDIALLSAEAAPGRLLFVEENIRETARALGVPVGPFRTWIALHETTHAFEFEAHPWLRPYLAVPPRAAADAVRRAMSAGSAARRCAASGVRCAARAAGEHWMERLMGEEQRRLFRETQAVMSLLEGFSDYVMDEVGSGSRPGRRADQRPLPRAAYPAHPVRAGDAPPDRDGPQARAVQEGRDLRPGDRRARGTAALARLWEGPETLPRDGEIETPERWITRVLDGLRAALPRARRTIAGPGRGAGGAPAAIALSPILSARYRSRDLERIRAAAPGARLVTVSVEGLADGPLDDVEVMLRGWLSSDAFDRLLVRAPQPRRGSIRRRRASSGP